MKTSTYPNESTKNVSSRGHFGKVKSAMVPFDIEISKKERERQKREDDDCVKHETRATNKHNFWKYGFIIHNRLIH